MLYSDAKYGELLFGNDYFPEDDSQEGGEQKYFIDLSKYVPPFIMQMKEFAGHFNAAGVELGTAKHYIDDLRDQVFPTTATWGITRWENVYDIISNDALTLEQRRAAILAKMRGARVCTPAVLKELSEALTGVETTVEEDFAHYFFTLYFVGEYGIPKNIRVLRQQVEEIKPAHLAFDFQYRYVIWNELAPYTWYALSGYTWDGIRVWKVLTRVTWHGVYNAGASWRSVRAYNYNNIKNVGEFKE